MLCLVILQGSDSETQEVLTITSAMYFGSSPISGQAVALQPHDDLNPMYAEVQAFTHFPSSLEHTPSTPAGSVILSTEFENVKNLANKTSMWRII